MSAHTDAHLLSSPLWGSRVLSLPSLVSLISILKPFCLSNDAYLVGCLSNGTAESTGRRCWQLTHALIAKRAP